MERPNKNYVRAPGWTNMQFQAKGYIVHPKDLAQVPGSELELLDVADDALRAANQFTLEAFKYVAGVKHETYKAACGARNMLHQGDGKKVEDQPHYSGALDLLIVSSEMCPPEWANRCGCAGSHGSCSHDPAAPTPDNGLGGCGECEPHSDATPTPNAAPDITMSEACSSSVWK